MAIDPAIADPTMQSLGLAPVIAMNLAIQDSVDHQRDVRSFTLGLLSKATSMLLDPVAQAKATVEESTDNALASQIAQLVSASTGSSQLAKVAYSTVPANAPAA